MKLTVRQISSTALMAAVICILSPIAIPLAGQVPVSLATLAVMLTGALLGPYLGTLAVLIYLLLGGIGLPVFAGWTGGFALLFGMTGGYLFGYLPLAFLTGLAAEKMKHPGDWKILTAGMIAGTAVLYLIGTAWFMKYTGMDLTASLAACVIPFLPGDCLKMIITCILVPRLMPAAQKITA